METEIRQPKWILKKYDKDEPRYCLEFSDKFKAVDSIMYCWFAFTKKELKELRNNINQVLKEQ